MSFPGMPGGIMGGVVGGRGDDAGMSSQEQVMVKTVRRTILCPRSLIEPPLTGYHEQMQAAMESCPAKTVISGGMGFVMGGAFGLFMSSMSYDTPLTPQGQEIAKLPVREQLRRGFKDMGSRSYSSAKNFGLIGAIFAGTECCIEGYRAKNDLTNGIAAGCITGGLLGAKAGPQAAAVGCVGFAAFSAAIDSYMRMPSDG